MALAPALLFNNAPKELKKMNLSLMKPDQHLLRNQ